MSVQWEEKYESGIDWADRQHRELVDYVASLVRAMEQGEGGVETIKIIKFLLGYVVTHFGDEETAMDENSYPGIAAHKEEHLNFKQMLTTFKVELDTSGASHHLTFKARKALVEWLSSHIAGTDRELALFLKEKAFKQEHLH